MAPFLFLIVAQGLVGLVKQVTRKNLFSGLKVGDKKVEVNLLQFADDTLFICESNVQNILCIKAMLRCFELSSGLRVNFHKSKIGAIGVDKYEVKMYSEILHCSLMDIPFTYLGLPIGGNQARCSFWEPVLSKIRKKLSALLAKWIWRMGSAEKGLWKDVLESKYGLWSMTNSFTSNRIRYKSRWWNDLSKVNISDQEDNWINSNMVWQLGSGDKIKFWEDEWLANGQLKGRYERIYNNSDLKDKTIENFGNWSTHG
ncbi:uncharacterized protein [Phaseolus vulgaris]|uniref:uncharacterized protein n=1 Tax=Phaseolus vulgaris TaxID=3885 RepID=UPI0035CB7DE2